MAIVPMNKVDSDIDFKPTSLKKYKGKTPEEISLIDPEYIVWAYGEYHTDFCSTALYRDSLEEVKDKSE